MGMTGAELAVLQDAARIDAIVAERAGVLKFARQRVAAIDEQIARGRISAEEASWLKADTRAVAQAIATGLHVADEAQDSAALRARLRVELAALIEALLPQRFADTRT